MCSSHAGGTRTIKGLIPSVAGLAPFLLKLLLLHRRKNHELQKFSTYLDAGIELLVNNGGPAPVFLMGGAAGAGTVAYVGGEMKTVEEISLNKAWNATQKAMKDLEFTITSKEKDAFNSQLIAKGAANKIIKIKLNRQSNMLTEIRIRVGTFGDESLSLQILEIIKKQF